MSLADHIQAVTDKIAAAAREVGREPSEITLVAATKVQTSETIRAAIAAGILACGENRVQELTGHLDDFAYDGAAVHFIGHLQTNKVNKVVGRVDLIESVDSEKLLLAIHRQAERLRRVQDILLEVNVGGELSKSGVSPGLLPALAALAAGLPHVRLRGLMAVPPPAVSPGGNRYFFQETCKLFVDIRHRIGDNVSVMDCLSMGMSGDYEDAVREGATLVRVGTALFGPRPPLHRLEEAM